MLRGLLAAGVAAPFIYLATIILGGVFNPQLSHMTSAPSDYGADGANMAVVVNAGFIAFGLAEQAAVVGLAIGLRRLGAGLASTIVTALCVECIAISFVVAGLLPLPHPLHAAFGIVLLAAFAPLSGAVALRKTDARAERLALLACFVAAVAIIAMLFGVGGVVTAGNVGLLARVGALFLFGAPALLCWAVLRVGSRQSAPVEASTSSMP